MCQTKAELELSFAPGTGVFAIEIVYVDDVGVIVGEMEDGSAGMRLPLSRTPRDLGGIQQGRFSF